jgi:hypothetical protein
MATQDEREVRSQRADKRSVGDRRKQEGPLPDFLEGKDRRNGGERRARG